MSNNTDIKMCPACGGDNYVTLTHRKWTHHDHDSGWAYEEGERVEGHYCDDCIADINRIQQAQRDYNDSLVEPTLEDWMELACKLATGINQRFSNWQDVANVSRRELQMLTEQMGENWQRNW